MAFHAKAITKYTNWNEYRREKNRRNVTLQIVYARQRLVRYSTIISYNVLVGELLNVRLPVIDDNPRHWTSTQHCVVIEALKTDTDTHTRFCTVVRVSQKHTYIFQGPEKSPRKKKRPRTFGPAHKNVTPK